MGKRFRGDSRTVVLAVRADEGAQSLVDAAMQLCRRTGMKLRIVQVAEYWIGRSWPRELTIEGPLAEAVDAVEGESIRMAEKHLRKMAESAGRGLEVETNVLSGNASECIIADALANRASLIITGAGRGSHRFVPRGMSTALSLMADAPIPVLVIQEGCRPKFDMDGQVVLIADDLSEHSERAVLTGFDLATALGKTKVKHVHVNAISEENLRVALEGVASASRSGQVRGISAGEIHELALKTLDAKLRQRAAGMKAVLEASSSEVSCHLRSGDVIDELNKAAEETKADFVVFGRHRAFRRKPFLIGQVPFYAMLSPDRPVLVVPAD